MKLQLTLVLLSCLFLATVAFRIKSKVKFSFKTQAHLENWHNLTVGKVIETEWFKLPHFEIKHRYRLGEKLESSFEVRGPNGGKDKLHGISVSIGSEFSIWKQNARYPSMEFPGAALIHFANATSTRSPWVPTMKRDDLKKGSMWVDERKEYAPNGRVDFETLANYQIKPDYVVIEPEFPQPRRWYENEVFVPYLQCS